MSLYPKPFYSWTTYDGHGGVDYPYAVGTPIRAVSPGRITFSAWWNNNAGWTRTLTTPEGIQIMHCHLVNLNGPPVGSWVNAGDIIGYVGNTGRSTGPHLHQEIWINGVKHSGAAYWRIIDKNRVIGATPAPTPGGGSASPSTPGAPSAPSTIDEDEMRLIKINDNYYAIGKQYLSHLNDSRQVFEGEILYGATRDLGRDLNHFNAELDLHGIPRGQGGALDDAGRVLNPQSGKYVANGTWSREREILAKLK